MSFTSIGFLPFVLAVLALSTAFGPRRRWLVLLVASYGFYATWRAPSLLVALAGVTLASYLCGLAMGRREVPARGGAVLWTGVALSVGILIAMKYAGFLAENLLALGVQLNPSFGFAASSAFASIGVSYYVLQAISYLLDVRNGATAPERHLGRYALHLAFFPKLLQGPVERAERLLPQLRDPAPIAAHDIAAAAQLFLWGLFQKVVVADRLAPFVDSVYGDVRRYQGVPLLVATYFFAAQVYFDFAGYTDMALGVGRLFGIRLTQNFDAPYLSSSVADFWRRWHISFSSWLLDYVFRPLQLGLRDWRVWGTPLALLVTFLVSGLWHGATWSFAAWGCLHGAYLGTSVLSRRWRGKVKQALGLSGSRLLPPLQVMVTFHLVCLAWIFFRSSTLADALYAVRHLASGLPAGLLQLTRGQHLESLLYLGQGGSAFLPAVASIALGASLRAYIGRAAEPHRAQGTSTGWPWRSRWVRTSVYALMFYLVAILGTASQSFLYQRY